MGPVPTEGLPKPPRSRGLPAILAVFAKIGLIGFGGGSALIPVVEKEVVQKRGWFDDAEFLRHTLVANVTPGALPVKLGAAAGMDIREGSGAWTAAMSVALPGVVLMGLLQTLFSLVGESAVDAIEAVSVGISLFIVTVLLLYVEKVLRGARETRTAVALVMAAFLLTGGKEVRQLAALAGGFDAARLPPPVFNLSVIDLMVATLFLILFLGLSRSLPRRIAAVLLAAGYAVVRGGNGWIPAEWPAAPVLLGTMAVAVAAAMVVDSRNRTAVAPSIRSDGVSGPSSIPPGPGLLFRRILPFLAAPAVLLAAAVLLFPALAAGGPSDGPTLLGYAGRAAASTGSSFGGGEAYVPVAEGFFVQAGYLSDDLFYNRIVALANALPGPILVKVASGIGFAYASAATGGNLLAAWLLLLLGLSVTVGVSSAGMILGLAWYDRLSGSPRLAALRTVILPVVCGMLVSTALSLLYEALRVVVRQSGTAGGTGLAALVAGVAALLLLQKKAGPPDLVLLAGAGGLAWAVLRLAA